ncbi:YbaB/EbfC family nucleoid-associated protein [Corynebacterium renale]|uniref:Nucleoid-associated protein ATK06_0557 n=1 Tax=Corynebacterium renale TaxID=1724 RepID=A0A2A9DMA7_9CORY|nr:YbaB/EbfC family nucleoid-associated protein [Corynebacterium renale]PFG27496.1 hypothetical protein ATK06_0557 [Corynebacterium renale]SQI23248.1 DNA-binding protein, YbaB/EbfC family [Corynebacterium renale]
MSEANLPDMQQILQQAQEMQSQLQNAQAEIMATELVGEAGNGLVKITLSGGGEVKAVSIDPQVVDPEDVETLQDLIVGAFADGHQKIGKLAEEKIGPLSQGLGGGSLGELFG